MSAFGIKMTLSRRELMEAQERQVKLRATFDTVCNKKDWKLPINCMISGKADQNLIREAIIHFTGSVPTFVDDRKGQVRVRAGGYYAACGA